MDDLQFVMSANMTGCSVDATSSSQAQAGSLLHFLTKEAKEILAFQTFLWCLLKSRQNGQDWLSLALKLLPSKLNVTLRYPPDLVRRAGLRDQLLQPAEPGGRGWVREIVGHPSFQPYYTNSDSLQALQL